MDREELLRRIERALSQQRVSAKAASREAIGHGDFVRDLRRHPASKVDASKLTALARVLRVPPAYFVDDDISDGDLALARIPNRDARMWSLAEEIAENSLKDRRDPKREHHKAQLIPMIYDVIAERVAAGASVDDPEMLTLVKDIMRRLVLHRILR